MNRKFAICGSCVIALFFLALTLPFWLRLASAACTNTTNLSLCKPAISDSGWGVSLNTNFDTIDTHDHSSGKGAQIPTTGIANSAISYAKMQNVSVTDRVLGRSTAGAGSPEEIPFNTSARDMAQETWADDQVWIADSTTAGTPRTITNCTDTGGNHLNYTQSTNSFSCGTSGGITTVRKTVDEIVNNSTTLQNDDDLFLAIAANETWFFQIVFLHVGNITADINVAFTVPTGATLTWGCSGTRQLSDGTIGGCGNITTSGGGQSYAAFTTTETVFLRGAVRNGGTAGNLQFQWAQNTATVVDTKVLTDSYLEAHK